MWGWFRGLFPGTDRSLGACGERAAATFLRKLGYRVIERNLRLGKDEADIVAVDPDGRTIVVVEVKTRREDRILPEEQVNKVKQLHLARFAQRLQRSRRFAHRPIRFDVIAIVWPIDGTPDIRHHVAAFDSPF